MRLLHSSGLLYVGLTQLLFYRFTYSISTGNIPSPVKGQTMIAIGFTGKNEESIWTFFTSLTLALLVVYQAAVFCLAFFRLVQALLHQRKIENKGSDKAHFINGIGWISAAAKLGAVETVVGFGGGDFGIDMTRRILRMLSRACMCIGVVKGYVLLLVGLLVLYAKFYPRISVDVVEDFQAVETEIVSAGKSGRQNFRRSRVMQYISNPRQSTFRQLSPTATGFQGIPDLSSNIYSSSNEKVQSLKAPHYTTFSQRQSMQTLQSSLPNMDYFSSITGQSEKSRVTVQFNNGTPKLYMRFSKLEVPSPGLIANSLKSRPQSEWYSSGEKSRPYTQSSYYFDPEKNSLESDTEELQRPKPSFHHEKADSSYRDSLHSTPSLNGPFEIVNTPVRKLSQEIAKPRIVRARSKSESSKAAPTPIFTSPLPHNITPETMAVMAFPEPIYYPPVQPQPSRPTTQEFNSSRVKSMASVKSVPDSIQAVRELAHQFPGPPAPFQYMPESETHSSWEEESRTSVLYPPGGMTPQAFGSPSELAFNITPEYKAAVTPTNRTFTDSQEPIDPFVDEEHSKEDYQLSSKPIYAPVGKPLRESLKVVVPPFVSRTRAMPEVPETAQATTPGTTVSGISMLELMARETSGDDDQYLDLGMALDTGTSRQFRPNRSSTTPRRASTLRTPITARKYTPKDERFSRIAEWVDSSATLAAAKEQAEAEMPTRDMSLQNLHDRGKSIDNLSIPWPKTDIPSQHNDEKSGRGGATSKKKPQLSRLKSVGRVPNQKTPILMEARHARASLHLRPIIIPPKNGNMPEAIQVESGSLESVGYGKGVLRDSEVLGMEDDFPVRGKTVQATTYF